MSKTSNVYARIEPETKEQAEAILSKLGIPSSVAINMFYNQIILNNGLPFDVKIPSNKILNEDLVGHWIFVEHNDYHIYLNGTLEQYKEQTNNFKIK